MNISNFIHEYRIFPRGFLTFYGLTLWEIIQWFEGIPDPTTQQVAFVTAFIGLGGAVFGFYTNTTSGKEKYNA